MAQIKRNQELLEQLGVSSREIEDGVNLLSSHNMVAKLSGAGGGGCLVAFTTQSCNEEDLVKEAESKGFTVYRRALDDKSKFKVDVVMPHL